MIKKFIHSAIALFLLLSQTEASFSVHFCDSKVASISINTNATDTKIEQKCCGEVEKDSKCCHNKIIKSIEKSETVFVKTIGFSPAFVSIIYKWLPNVTCGKVTSLKSAFSKYCFNSNAPPLFKRHCQLIFYDLL